MWPINSEVGCNIDDIFKDIGIEYIVPHKLINYLLVNFYRVGLIRRLYSLYKFLSNILFDAAIFDGDIVDYHVQNKLKKIDTVTSKSTVLVASCQAFNDSHYMTDFFEYLKGEFNRNQFNSFIFSDYISDRVDKELAKMPPSYVGIHIRRTDNFDTIKHGSDASYIYEIDKCLSLNEDQKFFLATDSEETKQYFRNRYGQSIFTMNTVLERNTVEGIRAGVVEMLLLSKSTKIICSLVSSYSTAATLLGNVKEVIYIDSFMKDEAL